MEDRSDTPSYYLIPGPTICNLTPPADPVLFTSKITLLRIVSCATVEGVGVAVNPLPALDHV